MKIINDLEPETEEAEDDDLDIDDDGDGIGDHDDAHLADPDSGKPESEPPSGPKIKLPTPELQARYDDISARIGREEAVSDAEQEFVQQVHMDLTHRMMSGVAKGGPSEDFMSNLKREMDIADGTVNIDEEIAL